jgi:hypothetical protein
MTDETLKERCPTCGAAVASIFDHVDLDCENDEIRASLAEFEQMVDRHDLTYSYSDDGEWWRRGHAQFDAIIAAARELPIEDVKRIWNAKCDTCLTSSAAPDFYWKDRWLNGTSA